MRLCRVEKRDESEGEWYTPAFLENRQKPDGERSEIEIFPLTKKEKDGLERGVTTSGRSRDVMKLAEDRQRAKIQKTIELRVGRIKLLWDPDGQAINTGKELWRAIEEIDSATAEEIVDELVAAITDRSALEEGLLGKSNSRSGSTVERIATS